VSAILLLSHVVISDDAGWGANSSGKHYPRGSLTMREAPEGLVVSNAAASRAEHPRTGGHYGTRVVPH
jgi:hypothetical protein